MQRTLSLLIEATNQANMSMHPTQSKCFTVNAVDQEPFRLGDIDISYQELYIYMF